MNVLITRRAQKRVSLRLKDENTLSISAPIGFPTEQIHRFISENREWIELKKQAIIKTHDDNSQIYAFSQILLNGQPLAIRPTTENKIFADTESLFIPQKNFVSFDKRRKSAIKFVKEYADVRLRKSISKIGTELGVCPSQIAVKFIRGTRIWGKCDINKAIIIDSRVVMLPPELQNYVIFHEFAHIFVFDHSKNFWKLVEKYVPDYKNCRQKLKNYAFLREIYC